jgi:hypothetical protein
VRCRLRICAAVVLVVGTAGSAQAQSRPGVEIAGGYQFLKLSTEEVDGVGIKTTLPIGWWIEGAAPVTRWLSLAGQVTGNYRSESVPLPLFDTPAEGEYTLDVHTFLGGVRANRRLDGGLVPFGHVLAGATRVGLALSATATAGGVPFPLIEEDASTTEFTVQVGGGFDFALRRRWSGRVGADYLRLMTEGGGVNAFRVVVGWVVPVSRR